MKAETIYLIYDGECPICRYAAKVIRLRESVGALEIINARNNHKLVEEAKKQGYEMDELGKKIRREGNEQLGIEKLKDGIAILEPILESTECGGEAWQETGNCYWNLDNFAKDEKVLV